MLTTAPDEPQAGQTIVIKYGGAAQSDPALTECVADEVVRLRARGLRPVVVHGGGAAVSAQAARLGVESRFVDGLRVTDPETMRIAQGVQVGWISRDMAGAIAGRGGRAIGLSGQDGGGWLWARPRDAARLGRVGDVVDVDAGWLRQLMDGGLIPVIAPVAVDPWLRALNVNADHVACAVAAALGASALLFLSDVDGVRGPDGAPARSIGPDALAAWIRAGVVRGGMVPKARACLDAVDAGVGAVIIADGRQPGCVEAALDGAAGTAVRPQALAAK